MTLVRNWRPALKEKLVYITPDNLSFDLHNPIPGTVLEMTGWGMPETDYGTTRGPFQQGSTALTSRLRDRVIKLTLHHAGRSRDEYWDNRSALIDIIRQNRTNLNFPQPGHLRWYRSNGTIRQADVFIESGPTFDSSGWASYHNLSYTDELVFRAMNPVIYDPLLNSESISGFACSSVTQLEFPFSFGGFWVTFNDSICEVSNNITINYQGNWQEYPNIIIGGPAREVRIVHSETGNVLEFDTYVIAAGEVVTFDLSYSRKTVTNNFGDNLIGELTSESTLGAFNIEVAPTAVGGVNNYEISLQNGSTDTYVQFEYYTRFPGI